MRFISLCAALALLTGSAGAQQVCTLKTELIKMLTEKYREQRVGTGVSGGAGLEAYVSEKGTFTIISTYPNGVACIIAAGQEWKSFELKRGIRT